MPKTRSGERITWREWFKRWGKGIEGVTPIQQTKASLSGLLMVIIGILWGMIVTFFTGPGWMFLCLLGSQVATLMGFLANWQKFKHLDRMRIALKELEGGKE